ncbi:Serine/threonine-protein phosphatase 2A activator [Balamuthia mandrillaris]
MEPTRFPTRGGAPPPTNSTATFFPDVMTRAPFARRPVAPQSSISPHSSVALTSSSSQQQQQSNKEGFVVPQKNIKTPMDLNRFLVSDTYKVLLTWIEALNNSVKRKANTVDCTVSPTVSGMASLVKKLSQMVDEVPPEEGSMRFGNKAFRTWHQQLVERVEDLHKEVLPESLHPAIIELSAYLLDSFGNSTRIDYGTGHELHFVLWMYCFYALGLVKQEDMTALVTRVFSEYLSLVRKIQTTYGQEPAGSRGVWCLDDHQFVPFIWGAAQLIDNDSIKPDAIMNQQLVEREGDNYLYLGCIRHINRVKSGPFFEHSPDLYNISGASSWLKINKGMIRKYIDDVLKKFPVMQHLLFGSLFRFE